MTRWADQASREGMLEVLNTLEPLGPEDQFPNVDATLRPVRDIDL